MLCFIVTRGYIKCPVFRCTVYNLLQNSNIICSLHSNVTTNHKMNYFSFQNKLNNRSSTYQTALIC